jgi:hypothetical protein
MVIVKPMNSFSGFIVGHQSAFRHGGTRGIAHHITDTSGNIFGIILVIIRLILGVLRINIEAIRLLLKTVVYVGAEGIAEVVENSETQVLYISHADNEDGALQVKELVLERAPFADVHIDCITPIVGSCVGPGTIIAFCYGKEVTVQGE